MGSSHPFGLFLTWNVSGICSVLSEVRDSLNSNRLKDKGRV